MSSTNLAVLQPNSDVTLYQYLNKINQIPSLTPEEECDLAVDYIKSQNKESRNKLIASHLKLAAKIAMQYKNYGLSLLDLISEANLGLIYAIKKFDITKGFRLSTYALWWIKATVQEYIIRSWSLVKIGTTAAQKKLFFSLSKIKKKITNATGKQITSADYPKIAHDLNVTVQDVAEMNVRMNPDISLNKTTNYNSEGKSAELIEFIPQEGVSHEMEIISADDYKHKKEALKQSLAKLSPRDRSILISRKLSNNAQTLNELSEKFKISKERVRQIEKRAMDKLKEYTLSFFNSLNQ